MQNYSNETTLDVCDFIQLVAYLLDANVTSQNASLSYLKSFKAIQSKYSQPESILETDDKNNLYTQTHQSMPFSEYFSELLIGKFISFEGKEIQFIFDNDYSDIKSKICKHYYNYESINSIFKHQFGWNTKEKTLLVDSISTIINPQLIWFFHKTYKNLPPYSPILVLNHLISDLFQKNPKKIGRDTIHKYVKTIIKDNFEQFLSNFKCETNFKQFDRANLALEIKQNSTLTHTAILNHLNKLIKGCIISEASEVQKDFLTEYYALIYSCGIILRATQRLGEDTQTFFDSLATLKAFYPKNIAIMKHNLKFYNACDAFFVPYHYSIHTAVEMRRLNSLSRSSKLNGLSELTKLIPFYNSSREGGDLYLFLEYADYGGVITGDNFDRIVDSLDIPENGKVAIKKCISSLVFITLGNSDSALVDAEKSHLAQKSQHLGKINTLIILVYIGLLCSRNKVTRVHELDDLLRLFTLSLPIRKELIPDSNNFQGGFRYLLNIQAICSTHNQGQNINTSLEIMVKMFHDYNKLIFGLRCPEPLKFIIHPLREAEKLTQEIMQFLMEVNTKMLIGSNPIKKDRVTSKFRNNCKNNKILKTDLETACENITLTQLKQAKPKYFPHSFTELLGCIHPFIDVLYPVELQQDYVPALIDFAEMPCEVQKQMIDILDSKLK